MISAARTKPGFFIGVGCPGCGGELELAEDFFVLTCAHCGSALRVVKPDVPPAFLVEHRLSRREVRFHADRYLKENALPLTDSSLQVKALYYPYWKINAILLKKRNRIIERCSVGGDDDYSDSSSYSQERTDTYLTPYGVTIPAGSRFDGVPSSLGMRADYLKAVPFAGGNVAAGFDALPVLMSWSEAIEKTRRAVQSVGSIEAADFGKNWTELFHPVGSLVYFPLYVLESYGSGQFRRLIVDGVTGRVVGNIDKLRPAEQDGPPPQPWTDFGQLAVELHRCRNCGQDLPTEQSYVYVCDNCHVLTVLEPHACIADRITVAASPSDQSSCFLPFWSFRLTGRGAHKVGKLLGGLHRSDRIVVPAFRMNNFESMYRLARRMSTAAPRLQLSTVEGLDSRFRPVTVGPSEAAALGRVVVRREEIVRNPRFGDDEADLQVLDGRLFYAPFHPEHYFYVDSVMGAVTIEKTQVG